MEAPVDFSSLFSKKRNRKKAESEPMKKKRKTQHLKEEEHVEISHREKAPSKALHIERTEAIEPKKKKERRQLDAGIREKLNALNEKETKKPGILNLNSAKKKPKKKKKNEKVSIAPQPSNNHTNHTNHNNHNSGQGEESESESLSSDYDQAVIVNSDEEDDAQAVRQSLVTLLTQRSLHYHGPPTDDGIEMSSEEEEEPVQPVDPAIARLASSTVMIGGLNLPLTKPELRRFLASCGRIKDVRFVLPSRDVPTKVAFVDFANKTGAYNAIQLHKTRHEGRVLTVQEATQAKNRTTPDKGSKHVMFVKHLPNNATEEELRDLFADCGKITSVSLPVTANNMLKVSGFAFVEFDSANALNQALRARVTLHGKKLIVENSASKHS